MSDHAEPPAPALREVLRHGRATRLWHWTNALTWFVMLMSGLMIFNAHPRLYCGHYGANPDKAWLEIGSMAETAFPGWITIPSHYSLADARLWHLAFAWVIGVGLVAYLVSVLARRAQRARLRIALAELAPAHLWHELVAHARLNFPTGEAALAYNTLQKLAYDAVLFVLLPAMVLSGLAMAPALDAAWPWLVDLFGGRQSARSIHFIAAALLVGFFLVHMAMVLAAGPVNEVRSMMTGRYRLPEDRT